MSEIYLAHQGGIGGFRKLVVLKSILPDIGGQEDFVRMFLDEARTTAAFNHPNIAQVFELDVDDGMLFMAMEFVQGCTLVEMARACRQSKEPIPIGFSLAAVRDTALALHYAHGFVDARGRRQLVIHRDVAEKNIMVTYEGVTKLLDFGIAKASDRTGHTSVGMVKGTSGYMSPEQIRGEPLDGRSDIFALGVVLHECLTGMRLFHGKNPEDGMMAALHQQVSPPSKQNVLIRPEVDALVLKALHRDKASRFSTALEFAREIEKAAPGMLWLPEQTAELVTRHFAARREETRGMIETAALGREVTGEVGIAALMAKVRQGTESKADALKEQTAESQASRGYAGTRSPTPVPAPHRTPVVPNPFANPPAPPPAARFPNDDGDTNPVNVRSTANGAPDVLNRDNSRTDALKVSTEPESEMPTSNPSPVPKEPQAKKPATASRSVTRPEMQKVVREPQRPNLPRPELPQFDEDAAGAKTAFASPSEIQAAIRAATASSHRSVVTESAEAHQRDEGETVDESPPSAAAWILGFVVLVVILLLTSAFLLELGPFAR